MIGWTFNTHTTNKATYCQPPWR